MAIWYDSKKREYASSGKKGWLKKYCDSRIDRLADMVEDLLNSSLIIDIGDGLNLENGILSVNAMTDEDLQKILEQI